MSKLSLTSPRRLDEEVLRRNAEKLDRPEYQLLDCLQGDTRLVFHAMNALRAGDVPQMGECLRISGERWEMMSDSADPHRFSSVLQQFMETDGVWGARTMGEGKQLFLVAHHKADTLADKIQRVMESNQHGGCQVEVLQPLERKAVDSES